MSNTTTRDVFVERAGVCRDFAHLGITLCRTLELSVCEYQDRNVPPVQPPVATGELVGIEKPVAIHAQDEANDGSKISARTLEVAD